MNNAKALFAAVFLIVAATFALFEYDVIPSALIADSPSLTYAIDLTSIILAIGGCFLLLYVFRIPFVRRRIEDRDTRRALSFHSKVCAWRLIVWMVITVVNVVLYYEASFANNPKYAILILFITGIFCWPNQLPRTSHKL